MALTAREERLHSIASFWGERDRWSAAQHRAAAAALGYEAASLVRLVTDESEHRTTDTRFGAYNLVIGWLVQAAAREAHAAMEA